MLGFVGLVVRLKIWKIAAPKPRSSRLTYAMMNSTKISTTTK